MGSPQFALMTYSFRDTVARGKLDLLGILDWCAERGFAAVDPWGPHIAGFGDVAAEAFDCKGEMDIDLDATDLAALDGLKAKAADVGLPLVSLAADQATHIWADEPWRRDVQRRLAKRWIDAGQHLGVRQMRFDPGYKESPDVPAPVMTVLLEGYRDLVAYAGERGIEILIENHWGAAAYPKTVEHILDRVDGLGLLFDTFNFAFLHQADGWLRLSPRARSTHIKCARWADDGEELTQHIGHAVRLLQDHGYDGYWGIEAMSEDASVGDAGCVERTMALVEKWHR